MISSVRFTTSVDTQEFIVKKEGHPSPPFEILNIYRDLCSFILIRIWSSRDEVPTVPPSTFTPHNLETKES